MVRRTLFAYAVAMLVVGAAWGWRAPLSWDERQYYVPAARFFAERVPGVPLDYPMPMPPAVLIVQGYLYRWTASVFVLRMLSTVAMIGAVAVFATALRDSRRDAALLLMFGTFPFALLNAFTLKHHAVLLLCCTGAFVLWQRKRVVPAALVLAIAALTHQIAAAAIATLTLLSLMERRGRDAVILAASSLPLAAIVLVWGGARPPMYGATFRNEPSVAGLRPEHVLVLLFMTGVWIAPMVGARLKIAAAALPFTAAAMYYAELMAPSEIYQRLAGPVSSTIAAATRHHVLAAAVAAGAIAAWGVAAHLQRQPAFLIWSLSYGVLMLAVPYFFESYYALFVAVAWLLLRERIAARPPWIPIAATLAGIIYAAVKL